MSVYDELIRLGALYIEALTSPYSCPRDRQVLLAKVTDLEEEANRLKVRAARAIEANESEIEERKKTLTDLRASFSHEPHPVGPGAVEHYVEAWQQEQGEKESNDLCLWEVDHRY